MTAWPRGGARSKNTTESYGYAVWWPGAVLGIGLLAAAYAKLDTSGVDWALGGAAKYHFIEDFKRAPTTWGLWIATHPDMGRGRVVRSRPGRRSCRRAPVLPRTGWRERLPAWRSCRCSPDCIFLQGHFWPLWWTLLLAFVPWDVLGRDGEAGGCGIDLAFILLLRRSYIALITAVVCIQLFASARRVEIEPFVSDYGMYSWTWPSTDAFDRQISRKYQVYHYVTANDSGNRST